MAKVSDGRHGDRHSSQRYADHERNDAGGGKGSSTPWASGRDAAYIEPRLVPDSELLGRDDSGGPEWEPYTAQFGDGGFVTGDKAHLSARGGHSDDVVNDEIRNMSSRTGDRQPAGPAKSKREAKE